MTPIHILIPVYNGERWIKRCVETAAMQQHDNFDVTVIDDASTDDTYNIVHGVAQEGRGSITIHRNQKNQKCPRNIYEAVKRSNWGKQDIIFLLDGDDWLPHSWVLKEINKAYTPDIWMTYGNFTSVPPVAGQTKAEPYPADYIKTRAYRQYNRICFNHPITFRKKLFDKIHPDDLKDNRGKWLTAGYDQAIMFPLLELATDYDGTAHFRYLSESLYVYNSINPQSDNLVVDAEVWRQVAKLWKRPPYLPMADHPNPR